jgi:hypothetical protein
LFVGSSLCKFFHIDFLLFLDIDIGQDHLLASTKEEDTVNILVVYAPFEDVTYLIDQLLQGATPLACLELLATGTEELVQDADLLSHKLSRKARAGLFPSASS